MGMLLSIPLMLAGIGLIVLALRATAASPRRAWREPTPLEVEIRRLIEVAGPMPVAALYGALPRPSAATAIT